jgi:hypothetical protein
MEIKNMLKVKVYSIKSPKTGEPVANQFEIRTEEGTYFQSYQSIIAFIPNYGMTILDPQYWNYSRTTSKYRSQFLGESTKETERKIKDDQYKMENLND